MIKREEKRNLESIPVGSLGIIPLEGCKELGKKVDYYLVKWRTERESEHKDSLAFAGYQRDTYLLNSKVPRFGSGEAKGIIHGTDGAASIGIQILVGGDVLADGMRGDSHLIVIKKLVGHVLHHAHHAAILEEVDDVVVAGRIHLGDLRRRTGIRMMR